MKKLILILLAGVLAALAATSAAKADCDSPDPGNPNPFFE